MKFPLFNIKYFTILTSFFLSFSFASAQTQSFNDPTTESNLKYFIGYVDAVISDRPILKIQTPCYVQIENFSDQNLNPEINVQAYLTLGHLSKPTEDSEGSEVEDRLIWIYVETRTATLITTNNKPPLYRYRATEPASLELIRDLNVILDNSLQPEILGVQYWHVTHPDTVVCNQLIEQKTEDEIKGFLNKTSHIFNSNISAVED